MDNFTYLKFVVRASTTDASTLTILVPVSDVKNTKYRTVGKFMIYLSGAYYENGERMRPIWYKSDTSISFGPAPMNYNYYVVPVYVYGCK